MESSARTATLLRASEGVVEADETYVGGKPRERSAAIRQQLYRRGYKHMPRRRGDKVPVMALIQRGGSVRALVVPNVTAANVAMILRTNVARSARLMTALTLRSTHSSVGHPSMVPTTSLKTM